MVGVDFKTKQLCFRVFVTIYMALKCSICAGSHYYINMGRPPIPNLFFLMNSISWNEFSKNAKKGIIMKKILACF